MLDAAKFIGSVTRVKCRYENFDYENRAQLRESQFAEWREYNTGFKSQAESISGVWLDKDAPRLQRVLWECESPHLHQFWGYSDNSSTMHLQCVGFGAAPNSSTNLGIQCNGQHEVDEKLSGRTDHVNLCKSSNDDLVAFHRTVVRGFSSILNISTNLSEQLVNQTQS